MQQARRQHLVAYLSLLEAWDDGLVASGEQGYLILTDKGKDAPPNRRQETQCWIDQENEARDVMVEAIQAYEEGLSNVSKEEIRRALGRWLLEREVFGGS